MNITEYYFKIVLLLINRIYPLNTSYDKRIYDAVNYIHNNYSKHLSAEELAKTVYLEKNYFIKLFKAHMGVSPYQYIRNHRINVSIILIQSGKSIKETAKLCGFLSESAFSQALKKSTGISPSELRKHH